VHDSRVHDLDCPGTKVFAADKAGFRLRCGCGILMPRCSVASELASLAHQASSPRLLTQVQNMKTLRVGALSSRKTS
jgi:hypothetical protein